MSVISVIRDVPVYAQFISNYDKKRPPSCIKKLAKSIKATYIRSKKCED